MQETSSIDNTAMSLEKEEITREEESMKEKEKILPKKLLKFSRFFTDENIHPFDEIEWSTTRVMIKNLDNKVIFDHEVEHPVQWNEMAVRTCADKYFKTHNLENHNQGGERSVRDVIHRVAYSVSHRGVQMGYFDEENGKILYDELCYLMINQMGAFNSPVFFNWGLYDVYNFKGNSKAKRWAIKDRDQEVFEQEFEYENPQGSACKSGDTWIYTNKGPMHLKDLVEKFNNGEEDIKVMSSHGYCNVIAAKYNGIKPTYNVILEGKNNLRITEDDEIFTKTEEGTENFRTVKEIDLLVKSLIDVKVKTKQIDGNSFWYLIKSIEYYGEEKVYDIETENHDFYANGILVHNCFITEVNDELVNGENGIYDWIQTEMSIFANGSGSGLNVSKIRGKDEPITGGGKSSGLISFLEVADASAGVIKSGGKCLAPDQYVYTENGPIKAKDLEDKEFICLSYDPPSNRFKAKKANCWKSGQKNIIEIITNNGSFTVSEDHPIKLSCGHALLAKDLKQGQTIFDCNITDTLQVILKDNQKRSEYLYALISEDIPDWNNKNNISEVLSLFEYDEEEINQTVIEVKYLGISDVYSVEVQCPTLDDKSENSGHNFVIWPNDDPFGVGIVVFNTRRAAKMIILDDNHPDLIDFIDWKKDEEFKARALMLMGYPQNWSDEKGAYKSVQAQNANNSIALTDDFMQAVINDDNWELKNVTDGKTREIIKARDILEKIVEANWECGDPGVFFIDTINNWNTIPNTGPIRSSNPCLAGDTLVATADGRNAVSIKQLAEEEKDVPVYSWNQDNQSMEIKWGRHPRLTGKNKKLLKITLDNGGQIRTTEDHKFILKDGSKIEAKDLELNMNLMSFNKNTLDELDVFEIPRYENVELSGNYDIVITKKCENCGSLFKRVYKDREAAYCSLVCSETAASSAGTEDRLETSFNEESKELSSSHKVVSIEEDGYEDVYNITVDDNHNVALITSIDTNNTEFSGICVLNCGEFLQPDNSSCNLASLNLVRFLNKDKTFNINAFKASIEYFITAMEIIVGGSSYPAKRIAEMTKDTRPLGLGYCNMGGLIMILGYPYDSDQARSIISTITSLETATAYAQSAKIASVVGPFNEYSNNKQEFVSIIKKHGESNSELKPRIKFAKQVHQAAVDTWSEATNLIQRHGARNSQVVVIAPTGCVTGDTLVLTSEGLLPITKLGNPKGEQWQDVEFNVMDDNGSTNCNKFYVNGQDECVKVSTKHGHEIKCTKKHKFRIIDEEGNYSWKSASDLQENDLLVMDIGGHEKLLGNKNPIKICDLTRKNNKSIKIHTPEFMNETLSSFLGYFMGDGFAGKSCIRMLVDEQDADVVEFMSEFINSIGLKSNIIKEKGCLIIHINSVELVSWFKNNNWIKPKGIHGDGAAGAFVPDAIMRSSSNIVRAFLRGLFEADGSVSISSNYPAVEFATVSKLLSIQVQCLLEYLGIQTTLRKMKPKSYGKRDIYRLRILNVASVHEFKKQISFISKRKNKTLKDGCDLPVRQNKGNTFRIINVLKEMYDMSEGLSCHVRQDIFTRLKQKRASIEWMKKYYNDYPDKFMNTKLSKIVAIKNAQFVQVKSVVDIGIKSTYDISVPREHSYSANCAKIHNTIMFLMGTTNNGIEPSYSLCSYKLMSDGSVVELLCEEAKTALLDLGYNKHQVDDISKYILQNGIVEGAPHLNMQHYPIFDTANVDGNGKRYIGMMAHVEAIAAATPFISGGISKTTNLPENATREDIRNCYIEAWKKGCKGLALYRSGSKWSQPLNSKNNKFKKETIKREIQRTKKRLSDSDFHKTSASDFWEFYRGLITRKKAENRAQSERFNFNIGSENVWMNIVRFPNNGISEVWLEVGKENPTVNGLADTIGRICSIAIQYGVPIEAICSTMEGLQFSPAGFLRKNDLGIRSAKSLSDLTSQVLTKLNAEYNGLDFEDITPVWNNDIELGEEPISVGEIEQAKSKGFSGTRCEKCGSWRTKGTIKCGICLSCQTPYGTCGG